MLDLGAPGMVRVGTNEVEVTTFREFLRQPFFPELSDDMCFAFSWASLVH